MIQRYGNEWHGLTDLQIELWCFKDNEMWAGRLSKYRHFRNAAKMLFPRLEWNPWLEWMMQTLCDEKLGRINTITREVVMTGAGSCGKTFGWGLFAFIWWLADPLNSTVFLTSTSAKMVGKRIWPVIEQLFYKASASCGNPGNLVGSQKTLQAIKGDDKHAIFAKAVGKGETTQAAADIQGVHSDRVLILLDEATDVQRAILTAIENIEKGAKELLVGKVGNAKSRFDPLGEAMTPKNGWGSITVEDEEWETEKGGFCLHFDGFKSPNVKAGCTKFRHIYSWENYLADQNKNQNTLEFWMYTRGFPAPEGVSDCVISEALILNHDGLGYHSWQTSKKMIGGWDPGFGGDPAPLYFAELGDIEGSKMGIQIIEKVEIEFNSKSTESVDYQIARQVIRECQKRGVAPECFGLDATAIGRGVYAIIYEEWSPQIQRVEFGGLASNAIVSSDDPRPGSEVYHNAVTEIWFRVRRLVEGNQIKGFTAESIRQFAMRKYELISRKIRLEPKNEYKSRVGRSPDDADCIAVLCEVAYRNGLATAGKGIVRAANFWEKKVREMNEIYTETPQPDEEEFEPVWAMV